MSAEGQKRAGGSFGGALGPKPIIDIYNKLNVDQIREVVAKLKAYWESK